LDEKQMMAIADDLCHAPDAKPKLKEGAKFFAKFRDLTAGGFYTTPEGMKADARSAAEVAWREYFAEPQLQAMIAQALEHNRDLRVAVLNVLEARATFQIRRADQFPTLDANALELRTRIPGQFNGNGNASTSSIWTVGASVVGWELDFWGRVRNLKDAALEQFPRNYPGAPELWPHLGDENALSPICL
jgi:outer membrane protein TolC